MDSQSCKDLNIFPENSAADCVYNMFKHTRTVGGRLKLREIMESGSSDIHHLIAIQHSIKYFYDRHIVLDINREDLDLIDHYLRFDKIKLKNNLLDSIVDFVRWRSTNDYYIIKAGIGKLIKLANYISKFIKHNLADDAPEHLIRISEKITELIEEGSLKQATKLNKKKLGFYQVSKLDHLIRGGERAKLQLLLQLVYELDVFENVSRVALSKGLCFPDYLDTDDVDVSISGLFHPAISNPVKNDVHFAKGKNMIFLTGSNMAGKSSILKSIGLAVYLSHIGFPVPAAKMKTAVFNGLITTINLPDNINQGLSHYYSEVKRVKEAAMALLQNEKMFVIFDELFRGTNVKDAFDASLLIISELSNIKSSLFLISTHIVELADELKGLDNISFKYLETYFENNKPVFTYQLKDGISKERLGMFIVQNEGIVDILRKASDKLPIPNPGMPLKS